MTFDLRKERVLYIGLWILEKQLLMCTHTQRFCNTHVVWSTENIKEKTKSHTTKNRITKQKTQITIIYNFIQLNGGSI